MSATVSAFLKLPEIAAREPDRLYARFDGREIRFRELAEASAAIARALLASGRQRGDRIAVMMDNRPLVIALIFAIARAGMVWVPINTRQQGESLAYVLEHCAPALLIADADKVPTVEACGMAPGAPPTLAVAPDAEALDLPAAPGASSSAAQPAAGDVFAIMYTSGTTGQPKGVQVTHRMFDYAARAVGMIGEIADGDVFFLWEPLYHIGGSQLLLLPLMARLHLHMVSRFSASKFWSEVAESGATHIHFLGGILQILLRQPPSDLDRAHRVRIAWGGGCAADDWENFERRFGVDIREAYGMTESSSITTMNIGGPIGSVGRVVPWFRVDIVNEAGQTLPAGERGEIVVTGLEPGALFDGYLDAPEATDAALKDGRLHTGDGGTFDAAGWLTFHGRLNDSVRRRGENISAWEIEHVALKHAAIAEAAMIGVRADIGEQDIKLFVRFQPGQSLAAADLAAWLRQRLGEYRTPRYITFVDAFPKTPSERIRKGLLSRETADCWDAENPDGHVRARIA